MKLVNPGLGEIADRLTILSLKLLYGTAAGTDTAHWRNERNALLVQARARALNGKSLEALLDLAAVNAALWQAEDELRGYRDAGGPREVHKNQVIDCAFLIQSLNDQRATLVQQINKDAGDGDSKEKL